MQYVNHFSAPLSAKNKSTDSFKVIFVNEIYFVAGIS